MKNPQRLIITDNEVMARQIAEAFGEVVECQEYPLYTTGNVSVLWTGGEMIELFQKDTFRYDAAGYSPNAEKIIHCYYNARPRKVKNSIPAIDQSRISYIEQAQTVVDEIIFMCQPTDEGERIIQALKLFFGFEVPTRTIICEWLTSAAIRNAVENGLDRTSKLVEFGSDEAMRRIFNSDTERLEPLKVGTEEITFTTLNLLNGIKWMDAVSLSKQVLHNRAHEDGVLDINTLYTAMAVKYDMTMESLWDSLVYLYGMGLISNPMTHVPNEADALVVNGQGAPDNSKDGRYRDKGIVPSDKRDDSLRGLTYDPENHPDAFYPRTSAIYSFIVDFHDGNLEPEKFDCTEIAKKGCVPITEVEAFLVNGDIDLYTKSVKDSFGSLMCELQCAELITIDKGLVKITELGYALSEDGELILSD